MKAFIREKFAKAQAVLSVCTGIFALARSGVLTGRQVTATRMFLPALRAEFPDVNFVEKRWECDMGNGGGGDGDGDGDGGKVKKTELWSAGGIVNGNDMVHAYLKAKFPPEISKIIAEGAEVAERAQDY